MIVQRNTDFASDMHRHR